jgi:hypothetical protein
MHTRFEVFCDRDVDMHYLHIRIVCLGCRSSAYVKVLVDKVIRDENALRNVTNNMMNAHTQAYL